MPRLAINIEIFEFSVTCTIIPWNSGKMKFLEVMFTEMALKQYVRKLVGENTGGKPIPVKLFVSKKIVFIKTSLCSTFKGVHPQPGGDLYLQ